jgi:hypothetical protein
MADWQFVNKVALYGLLGNTSPDEAAVTGLAERAVENPDGYLTTEEIYAGIAEALRSGTILTDALPGPLPSEHEYRAFLGLVLDRLDALRPWPEAPFQNLDPLLWRDWGDMPVAARIRLSFLQLMPRVRRVFVHVDDDPRIGDREVLALRLKTGTEVALVARWWPDSKDVALLQRDPRLPPRQVVAEFLDATELSEDEVALVEE